MVNFLLLAFVFGLAHAEVNSIILCLCLRFNKSILFWVWCVIQLVGASAYSWNNTSDFHSGTHFQSNFLWNEKSEIWENGLFVEHMRPKHEQFPKVSSTKCNVNWVIILSCFTLHPWKLNLELMNKILMTEFSSQITYVWGLASEMQIPIHIPMDCGVIFAFAIFSDWWRMGYHCYCCWQCWQDRKRWTFEDLCS